MLKRPRDIYNDVKTFRNFVRELFLLAAITLSTPEAFLDVDAWLRPEKKN